MAEFFRAFYFDPLAIFCFNVPMRPIGVQTGHLSAIKVRVFQRIAFAVPRFLVYGRMGEGVAEYQVIETARTNNTRDFRKDRSYVRHKVERIALPDNIERLIVELRKVAYVALYRSDLNTVVFGCQMISLQLCF